MNQDQKMSRRERNKHETRERLLDAASTLFAVRGVIDTTVEEIADAAGVSRATFFNYFPGKDVMLAGLHTRHMDLLSAVISDLLARDLTTEQRIHGLFEDFVAATEQLPGYLRAVTGELERDLATPEISVGRTERFNDEILRILEPGLARGEVRTDYPPRFLAQMIAAVYVSTIRYWRQDPEFDLTDGFRKAASYAAESLVPRD
ncbi:TetR/AcrR family transcriptional regulator [Rhodococcus sp. AG1013]|uniref:TetR/AcrR family transcriptional regulator n=1 Tax=unclassified Rhodococcus (in: high G+C Gram-positive bacteria) TaxID=192944 RepID=UPI000E0C244B|nr:TetR/AcrR family transcriptional regulator [Rhodococcus sp. AG1013]RDI19450.1 TetR family transcriptional regulator [Rhodococcus sp. AG1013]